MPLKVINIPDEIIKRAATELSVTLDQKQMIEFRSNICIEDINANISNLPARKAEKERMFQRDLMQSISIQLTKWHPVLQIIFKKAAEHAVIESFSGFVMEESDEDPLEKFTAMEIFDKCNDIYTLKKLKLPFELPQRMRKCYDCVFDLVEKIIMETDRTVNLIIWARKMKE